MLIRILGLLCLAPLLGVLYYTLDIWEALLTMILIVGGVVGICLLGAFGAGLLIRGKL